MIATCRAPLAVEEAPRTPWPCGQCRRASGAPRARPRATTPPRRRALAGSGARSFRRDLRLEAARSGRAFHARFLLRRSSITTVAGFGLAYVPAPRRRFTAHNEDPLCPRTAQLPPDTPTQPQPHRPAVGQKELLGAARSPWVFDDGVGGGGVGGSPKSQCAWGRSAQSVKRPGH